MLNPKNIAAVQAMLAADQKKAAADSISHYGFQSSKWKNTPFLTPKELADVLSISVRTLARLRAEGSGPPFIKIINGRIRYPIKGLDAWVAKLETTKSEAS